MENIRTDKDFLCYANDFVLTIAVENNNVIQIRAVAQELVFLETCSDKAFLAIDIEFFVGLNNGFDIDIGEVTHLRFTRILVSVFGFEVFKPANGIIGQMMQVFLGLLDFLLEVFHQLVGFFGVELGYTNHANIEEFFNILSFHLANKFGFKRLQGLVHKRNQLFLVSSRLVAFLLINAVLDKYTLKGSVEILLLQFGFLYLQFPL